MLLECFEKCAMAALGDLRVRLLVGVGCYVGFSRLGGGALCMDRLV